MFTLDHRTGNTIVIDRSQPASVALGFITVIQEPTGWVGGYLVTNAWGRPLEFRLTSAVQPNRVQTVLYGPTLDEYLHADVIGKALIEKTAIRPDLIVTDCPAMLGLRSRVEIPVIGCPGEGSQGGFGKGEGAGAGANPLPATVPLAGRAPLFLPSRFASDEPLIAARLEVIDPAVDLTEPFSRIREAVSEARKMGASRAA